MTHDIEERPIDVAERKLRMVACRRGRLRPATEFRVNFAAVRTSP